MSRVTSVLATPFDLSNNNMLSGALGSYGDFTSAVATCKTGGCDFFVNDTTTSFGMRARGFFAVTASQAGLPVHFGVYADDGASLTFFDAAGASYAALTQPSVPRLVRVARDEHRDVPEGGPLRRRDPLRAQIVEDAALEVSTLEGTFTDFQQPANQAPVVRLADAGFAPRELRGFYPDRERRGRLGRPGDVRAVRPRWPATRRGGLRRGESVQRGGAVRALRRRALLRAHVRAVLGGRGVRRRAVRRAACGRRGGLWAVGGRCGRGRRVRHGHRRCARGGDGCGAAGREHGKQRWLRVSRGGRGVAREHRRRVVRRVRAHFRGVAQARARAETARQARCHRADCPRPRHMISSTDAHTSHSRFVHVRPVALPGLPRLRRRRHHDDRAARRRLQRSRNGRQVGRARPDGRRHGRPSRCLRRRVHGLRLGFRRGFRRGLRHGFARGLSHGFPRGRSPRRARGRGATRGAAPRKLRLHAGVCVDLPWGRVGRGDGAQRGGGRRRPGRRWRGVRAGRARRRGRSGQSNRSVRHHDVGRDVDRRHTLRDEQCIREPTRRRRDRRVRRAAVQRHPSSPAA